MIFLQRQPSRVSDELAELYSKYAGEDVDDLRKDCFFKAARRDKSYYMTIKVPMGVDVTVFDRTFSGLLKFI